MAVRLPWLATSKKLFVNPYDNMHFLTSLQINAPLVDAAHPIQENMPGYIAMAFSTLFPDGKADFNQPRLMKIELGAYFKHLMRYSDNHFTQHRRFPWFAFNTLQRQRSRSQARIFVKQNPEAAGLKATDIQKMLNQGNKSLAYNMMRYRETLRGTRTYWAARRRELLDMITVMGTPHLFFTLSAADLQWTDLHEHMPDTGIQPEVDPDGKRRRRAGLNGNPHIAAQYLDERLKAFMTTVVHPLLGVRDFWYRYEWQLRGSGHIHGFLWLKDAPKAEDIDWTVLKDVDRIITDEQAEKMRQYIKFWEKIVVATNPFPRTDENTPLVGQHPCNRPPDQLHDTKEELSTLLNWVERHTKCMPGYCQVKRKVPEYEEKQTFCRFDYPMETRNTAGIGLDSRNRVRFEPKRNDRLLNTFNVPMILAWQANIDVKPVLSKDAAIK